MVDCQGALQQRERERERKLPELVIISFVRVIFARQMHRHLWEIFHIAGAENIFWIAPKIKIIFEMGGGRRGALSDTIFDLLQCSMIYSVPSPLKKEKLPLFALQSALGSRFLVEGHMLQNLFRCNWKNCKKYNLTYLRAWKNLKP